MWDTPCCNASPQEPGCHLALLLHLYCYIYYRLHFYIYILKQSGNEALQHGYSVGSSITKNSVVTTTIPVTCDYWKPPEGATSSPNACNCPSVSTIHSPPPPELCTVVPMLTPIGHEVFCFQMNTVPGEASRSLEWEPCNSRHSWDYWLWVHHYALLKVLGYGGPWGTLEIQG